MLKSWNLSFRLELTLSSLSNLLLYTGEDSLESGLDGTIPVRGRYQSGDDSSLSYDREVICSQTPHSVGNRGRAHCVNHVP